MGRAGELRRHRLGGPPGAHRTRLAGRGRPARAADGLPARRPGLAGDVEGLSGAAVRRAGLPRPGLFAPGLWPSTPARGRRSLGPGLHAPPGARGAAGLLRRWASTCRPRPPWLFGHSDGGSIALLYAARPAALAGAVVLAPHILVEDLSVASIAQARAGLRDHRPAPAPGRYHDDPDSAFYGWNDIWLHPPFKHWSIEERDRRHPLPAAGRAGPGRRVRHAGADALASRRRVPQTTIAGAAGTAAIRRTATSPKRHRDRPADAEPDAGFVSVLSPVGAALLGRRVGSRASWVTPDGRRHEAEIVAVLFQPEASGDYTT
jgi:pimeloyl-ACP methyl ester carboxylesterase